MTKSISSDPRIARLYQNVPSDSRARLLAFRESYPYQTAEIGGNQWRFIDTGEGEQVLFIPAGGTAVAEVSFNSLAHFAQKYRVISPDYPPIEKINDLFEGFIQLLDKLGVDQFAVMGGSYGGWMVQSFVRQYPERINKMVITAVGPPNKENSQELARLMVWFQITPTFLLRWMINRSFSRLESTKAEIPEFALMWALVREAVYFRIGRADILALMERLIDQTENYSFSAEDLQSWPGRILLVFGSQDPGTPPEKREEMIKLYPQAQVKVFSGGEHGIAITHQQEYFAVIDDFLAN